MSQEEEHLSHEILMAGNSDEGHFPVDIQVLAFDSNPLSLRYLVQLLEHCQYKVAGATKADEALALLRDKNNKFDIVIADVVSNDITGFQLVEIISLEMDIPVVLLSEQDDYESVMKGIKHGARDYITKPPRVEEMKKMWHHVYRKKLEHRPHQQKSYCSSSTTECSAKEQSMEQSMEQKENSLKRNREWGKDVRNDTDIDVNPSCHKRERLSWAPELHQKFVDAVFHLGIENAVPSKILNLMDVPGLTREKVGSHLQKFRQSLKKGAARRKGTCSSNSTTAMDTAGVNNINQTGRQPYPRGSSHVINQMPHDVQNQRQQCPLFVAQFPHLQFRQNPNIGGLQQQQQQQQHVQVQPVVFPDPTVLSNNIGGGSNLPLYSATTDTYSPALTFPSLIFGGSSCPTAVNLSQEPFVSTTLEIRSPASHGTSLEEANSEILVHGGSEYSNRIHRILDPASNMSEPGVALQRGSDNNSLRNYRILDPVNNVSVDPGVALQRGSDNNSLRNYRILDPVSNMSDSGVALQRGSDNNILRNHRILDPVSNMSVDPGFALQRVNDNNSLRNHLERAASKGEDEIIVSLVRQFQDDKPPML